ncbi:MAG: xanthine dehydrogenase, partial [Microcoleus sp. SIO2G3]|nr:xanthine dehydrogenase [Microcoleus sp. SIO2G3]
MLEFYQQLAQVLVQNPVVLATVTHIKGSVPREVGAKMFVCRDSCIGGTIGGGAGEAKVITQALKVLETGEKQFVEIDLSGAQTRETQGVCGGMMQVWLEHWVGKKAIALVHQILDILNSGQAGVLITPFDLARFPYVRVSVTDGTLTPYLKTTIEMLSATSLSTTALVEPLLPLPTLLIIGAGHIAVPLAKIAKQADFRVVVQDDRPEFASKERFPEAALLLALPIASALDTLPQVHQLYVALVTRGTQHDLEALRILLQQPTHYIGMIGSQKRVRTVYKKLEQEGVLPNILQSIHAPIGLDIGALTPEEIAISICAELI